MRRHTLYISDTQFCSYLQWWSWVCPWPAACSCYTWKHKPLVSALCRWSPGPALPLGSPAEGMKKKKKVWTRKWTEIIYEMKAGWKTGVTIKGQLYSGSVTHDSLLHKQLIPAKNNKKMCSSYSGEWTNNSPLSTSSHPAPTRGASCGSGWQTRTVGERGKRKVSVRYVSGHLDPSGQDSCGSSRHRSRASSLETSRK